MVIGAMPMPAETSDTARLRCVSNQPVTQAIIGTMIAAALAPTRSPKIKLEREKRCRLGRQSQADRQADRARHDNSARAEPIGEAAPGDAAERHGEKADGHGARHAGHRPAGVPSNGLQQNGQREHRSDRDAAQKAARRDDHPSVARFGHRGSIPTGRYSGQERLRVRRWRALAMPKQLCNCQRLVLWRREAASKDAPGGANKARTGSSFLDAMLRITP